MRSPSIRGRGHLAGALGGELLLGVEVLEAPDGLPEGVVLGHTPRAGALQGTPSGGGWLGFAVSRPAHESIPLPHCLKELVVFVPVSLLVSLMTFGLSGRLSLGPWGQVGPGPTHPASGGPKTRGQKSERSPTEQPGAGTLERYPGLETAATRSRSALSARVPGAPPRPEGNEAMCLGNRDGFGDSGAGPIGGIERDGDLTLGGGNLKIGAYPVQTGILAEVFQ